MKFERFTVKAREVISDAQALAGKFGNPEIRPQHFLMVLLPGFCGVTLLSEFAGIQSVPWEHTVCRRVCVGPPAVLKWTTIL